MENYNFKYNKRKISKERQEELTEMAFSISDDISWENELKFLINELKLILNERYSQVRFLQMNNKKGEKNEE